MNARADRFTQGFWVFTIALNLWMVYQTDNIADVVRRTGMILFFMPLIIWFEVRISGNKAMQRNEEGNDER